MRANVMHGHCQRRRYTFHVNTAKFPNLTGLVAACRAGGLRTVANVKPCLLDDHPLFQDVCVPQYFTSAFECIKCCSPLHSISSDDHPPIKGVHPAPSSPHHQT